MSRRLRLQTQTQTQNRSHQCRTRTLSRPIQSLHHRSLSHLRLSRSLNPNLRRSRAKAGVEASPKSLGSAHAYS